MRKIFVVLFLLTFFCVTAFAGEKYRDRWFYASYGLNNDENMERIIALIKTARQKDLNGMLWSCGVENYNRWDQKHKDRLARVKKIADENGIEIIPILWSVGYGTMLGVNPNLAACQRITGLPMTVRGKKAFFSPSSQDQENQLDFETFVGNKFKTYFHDMPGKISFADTTVKHSGKSSIRYENFTANQYGHGRLARNFELPPNREYCLSIWYKTERIQDGNFMLQMYRQAGDSIVSCSIKLPKNGSVDWREGRIYFNSGSDGKVRFYGGIWKGVTGKFWFDDMKLTELGFVSPLQRPGTPITVKNAENGTVYTQGKDYVIPKFKLNLFNPSSESLTLDIPAGSKINDGARLAIDYYFPVAVSSYQVSVCMSEPELYRCFEESAKGVMKALAPKKWFLSMDEIRAGGACRACKDRNISLAQILGDCITKQFNTIRNVQPEAEVYIWSDMLDPGHNCHKDYFTCEGDFTGAWNYIPKEIIISCWYHKKRAESMKFFSENGFRTQGAAYYDTDDLKSCADWLETCNQTPNCTGIMYTTWQNKYKLLVPFGDLVREKSLPKK